MKYLVILMLVMLVGCAGNTVAYDDQFCNVSTKDTDGIERCHSWTFGANKWQDFRFRHPELGIKAWGVR